MEIVIALGVIFVVAFICFKSIKNGSNDGSGSDGWGGDCDGGGDGGGD